MIQGMPLATKAVVAWCAMQALRQAGDVVKSLLTEFEKSGTVGIVIEIARDDNMRLQADVLNGLLKKSGDLQAIGLCFACSAIAAGGMDDKDVKGVARIAATLDIKDVTGGTHALGRQDSDGLVTKGMKAQGMIEQGNIDATQIGRLGHQVMIAGIAKEGTAGQVSENGIVLDLDQGDKVGQLVGTRQDLLTNTVYLAPVFGGSPMASAIGKKLCVLLPHIVMSIEQILAVQLNKGEKGGQQKGYQHRLADFLQTLHDREHEDG